MSVILEADQEFLLEIALSSVVDRALFERTLEELGFSPLLVVGKYAGPTIGARRFIRLPRGATAQAILKRSDAWRATPHVAPRGIVPRVRVPRTVPHVVPRGASPKGVSHVTPHGPKRDARNVVPHGASKSVLPDSGPGGPTAASAAAAAAPDEGAADAEEEGAAQPATQPEPEPESSPPDEQQPDATAEQDQEERDASTSDSSSSPDADSSTEDDTVDGVSRRIVFAGKTTTRVELQNTSNGRWLLAWPLHLSVLSPVHVPNTNVRLEQGSVYEVRFITERMRPSVLRGVLGRMGWVALQGPFLLRRHIHHPGLAGELLDWVFRGIWEKPSQDVRGFRSSEGDLLIEDIAST